MGKHASPRLLFNSYGNQFGRLFPGNAVSVYKAISNDKWTVKEKTKKTMLHFMNIFHCCRFRLDIRFFSSSSHKESESCIFPISKKKNVVSKQQFKLKNYTRHWLMLKIVHKSVDIFVAAKKSSCTKWEKRITSKVANKNTSIYFTIQHSILYLSNSKCAHACS